MLEEQSVHRLCQRKAGCFAPKVYDNDSKLMRLAKKRVGKYMITKSTDEDLEKLHADVTNNPDKLFLLIADEAHWGIASKSNLGEGANHKTVNFWDHSEHTNVLLLLVSATPWNLLTENLPNPRSLRRRGEDNK